ncbi:helix-turn-helix transcriptional regulator [Curtobacterium sp. RRHDQ10]|uniref:helix-turn-helix transcriptional regulator n=1 Tax=Curtobacterium phyllosphaerae TaxID=3413379 RepID=UPI003BF2C6C6
MATRGEFAVLLRAWRDRLHPTAVGLPAGPGRRASGIRREELAALAGISVDYVIRLEQGRADTPSGQVVAALARSLQLDEAEREQLFVAAGLAAPLPTSVPTLVPPSIQRLITRLGEVGVAVYAADWTLLSTNAAWDAIHGVLTGAGRERNLLWRHFSGAPERLVRVEAETARFERAIVSDLRIATIRYPRDPSLRRLVGDLVRISPRFAELWADVRVAHHQTEHKTILHPDVGPIALDCDVLSASGTDLRIVTFTAEVGSEDAVKLDLARTLGSSVVTG